MSDTIIGKKLAQQAKATTLDGQLEILREDEEAWKSGDYRRCVNLCSLLIDGNIDQPKANFFVRRARASLELGRISDVLGDTERAIRLQPSNSKAFALQGYASLALVEGARRNPQFFQNAEMVQLSLGRVKSATASLMRAKELDASIEETDAFKRSWRSCERERQLLEESCAMEATPFLNGKHGTLDKQLTGHGKGEDALIMRATVSSSHIPSFDDSVLLKCELLYFLASLSRRCFQSPNQVSFIDTIKQVRTIREHREALERAEQKFGFDAQLQSWPKDRYTWLMGVRLAASSGELLVGLRSLKASMRSWAFETRPDLLAQQVRAIVNDIEGIGEEVLEPAHTGENRELCICLLTKITEALPREFSCGLSVVKARLLNSSHRLVDAVQVLNEVVETYNKGLCSKSDLDAALSVRDAALRKAGSSMALELRSNLVDPVQQVPQELLLTPIGFARGESRRESKGERSMKPLAPRTLPTDDEIEQAWSALNVEERRKVLTVRLDQLEKTMSQAILRRILPALHTSGTHQDVLEAYRNASGTNEEQSLDPIVINEASFDGGSKGLTKQLQEESPEEAPLWIKFEAVTDMMLMKTSTLGALLKVLDPTMKTEPFAFGSPPPKRPTILDTSRWSEHALEIHVLHQRSETVLDFEHTSITGGWKDSNSSSATARSSLQQDTPFHREAEDEAQLLFENVYCVGKDPSSSYSTGLFVPERCARICHAGQSCFAVGRAPLRSQCGEGCLLVGSHVCKCPKIERVTKQAISLADEPDFARKYLGSRPPALTTVLREELLSGDDEETFARRLLQAMENTKVLEKELRKSERWQWAFDQIKILLKWTIHIQKAFVVRYGERQIRDVEDFAGRAIEFHRSLLHHVRQQPIDPDDDGKVEDPALLLAVNACASSLQDRQQLRWTLSEAKGNLVMDEERLISATSSPATSASLLFQQQVLREDFDKLSAMVISRQQHVAYLDSRVAEGDVIVQAAALHLAKTGGITLKEKARWVLGHLSATEVAKLQEDTPIPEDELIQIAAIRASLAGTNTASVDVAELAAKAADMLRFFPRISQIDHTGDDKLDKAWREMDAACNEARLFIMNCYQPHMSRSMMLEVGFKGFGIEHVATHDMNQTVSRQKISLAEAVVQERWRRAEFMRYIHTRNQVLFGALLELVCAEVRDLRSTSVRDELAKQLMEEEDRLKKKKEKKKQQKKLVTVPVTGPSVSKSETAGSPLEEKKNDEEKNGNDGATIRTGRQQTLALNALPLDAASLNKTASEQIENNMPVTKPFEGSEPAVEVTTQEEDVAKTEEAEWIPVGAKRQGGAKKVNHQSLPSQSKVAANENFTVAPKRRIPREEKNGRRAQQVAQQSPFSSTSMAVPQPQKSHIVDVNSSAKANGGMRKDSKREDRQSHKGELKVCSTVHAVLEEKDQVGSLHQENGTLLPAVPKQEPAASLEPSDSGNGGEANLFSRSSSPSALVEDIRFGRFSESEDDDERIASEELGNGMQNGAPKDETSEQTDGVDYELTENAVNVDDERGPYFGAIADAGDHLRYSQPQHPLYAPPRPMVPAEWICPLTHQVMMDPVTAADGRTYEGFAIASFIARNPVSPVTGVPLENLNLIPNHALRLTIQANAMRPGVFHYPPQPIPLPPASAAQGGPFQPITLMPSLRPSIGVPVPPQIAQPRAICVFFQQGTCRYGPGCRNLHVMPPTHPFGPAPLLGTSPSPSPSNMQPTESWLQQPSDLNELAFTEDSQENLKKRSNGD